MKCHICGTENNDYECNHYNKSKTFTHQTKKGFGGLLSSGVKVNIINEIVENRVFVIDNNDNYWHGNKNDLELINPSNNSK
jgi:hypothetical protein